MAGTACGAKDAGANGNMALPLGAAPVVKGRIGKITGETPVLQRRRGGMREFAEAALFLFRRINATGKSLPGNPAGVVL